MFSKFSQLFDRMQALIQYKIKIADTILVLYIDCYDIS